MQDFVYIIFTKKQTMIARKGEISPKQVSLLFSASPKFDWIPLGGRWTGVLNNCSGVNFVRKDGIIDLWSVVTLFKGRLLAAKTLKWDLLSY